MFKRGTAPDEDETEEAPKEQAAPHADILSLVLRQGVPVEPKPIATVSGEMPPLYNLRDHPEFTGRAFTIVRVKEAEGEFGYHLILAGFLAASKNPKDDPQPVILRTGSENVLGRIVPAMEAINGGNPLFGLLRAAGRAWFLD